MKTTIYELLGMIKDNKAPKKIMYRNKLWENAIIPIRAIVEGGFINAIIPIRAIVEGGFINAIIPIRAMVVYEKPKELLGEKEND